MHLSEEWVVVFSACTTQLKNSKHALYFYCHVFYDFPCWFVQYSVFLNFSKHNLYLLLHFWCYLWIAGIILATIKQVNIKKHSAACLVGQTYQSRTQRFPGWSKAPVKGSLKMYWCGYRTLRGWRENWGGSLSPGMPRWRRCETASKKTSNRRAMLVLLLLSSYFSSALLHKCGISYLPVLFSKLYIKCAHCVQF